MITVEIRKADRCSDVTSLYVSFNYNVDILNIIRSFPVKYWDKDNKTWELPTNQLETLVNLLSDYPIDIIADAKELVRLMSVNYDRPDDFEFKTTPFEHQVVGFEYGLQHDRWLLADEQGLGKTKQVIDIAVAKKSQRDYKHCLIICGVNGLKWNWYNEILTHSNECPYILGQRCKRGKIVIGSNADKLVDIKELANNEIQPYFIITNVESLRDAKILTELQKLCEENVINMIAFDECHKAKNPTSQQGKGILKLHAETMIAMTGTPLMNNPLDLYIILKWLGYESHTFYAFKNHYCVMGGFGGYEVMSYKNLEELQDQLNVIMLRRKKEEVLDLPEKTHVDEYVDMTGKQAQIYKEISMNISANIDQIKSSTNPLAELIRMRQATGYTGILSSTIQESAKLDRMEELVEEAIENGKKVVIFSNWTQMTDVIQQRILKMGWAPLVITGETKDEDRQQIVWNFQNRENNPVIIGTIGAMGTGLTLTAGTVEIFMDEPWNRALKDQAEDRCHRISQNNNVTIYTLMCKNTIDERIHELVYQKGALSDALVDGVVKQNKSDIVDFLLS